MATLETEKPLKPGVISDELMHAAHEIGIKLEYVGGMPVWEASPVFAHQAAIFRIQSSIRPPRHGESGEGCACVHVSDLSMRFPVEITLLCGGVCVV